MTIPNIPAHTYVRTQADWNKCVEHLRTHHEIAIDLESNSMYVFREYMCLIQISTRERDFIVDPLADIDLTALGQLLSDPSIQKIFHAAEYDLTLIKREYNWELNNLFDTMWAARILGYSRVGLANLIKHFFDIDLDKRFQRADWGQRPLTVEQLAYAQRDTHFLFQLRDVLEKELIEKGHKEESVEIFGEQTNVKAPPYVFNPDDFWSINGVQALTPRGKAVFRELYIFRQNQAEKRNRPVFKVMNNKVLLLLSRELPINMADLKRIPDMPRRLVQRRGKQILSTMQRGMRAPIPQRPPRPPRPPQETLNRYDLLQQWRKLRGQARGVESDVIMSRESLWAIAQANPTNLAELETISAPLGPWRFNKYGSAVIELLTQSHTTAVSSNQ